MANTTRTKHKEFIDFNKLTKHELTLLSRKWENAARAFEFKVEGYKNSKECNQDKLLKLWQIANNLWRRVNTLERWRIKNKR